MLSLTALLWIINKKVETKVPYQLSVFFCDVLCVKSLDVDAVLLQGSTWVRSQRPRNRSQTATNLRRKAYQVQRFVGAFCRSHFRYAAPKLIFHVGLIWFSRMVCFVRCVKFDCGFSMIGKIDETVPPYAELQNRYENAVIFLSVPKKTRNWALFCILPTRCIAD